MLSRTARGEPALERRLALEGAPSGDERVDANVFVEGGPVNPLALADEAPVGPFHGRRTLQAPKPDARRSTCGRPEAR